MEGDRNGVVVQTLFENDLSLVIGEHKIFKPDPNDPNFVVPSTNDTDDTLRKNLAVDKIIIHDNFNAIFDGPTFPYRFSNNLALLRLKDPVDISIYTPVCLPNDGSQILAEESGWIVGWGSVDPT